VRDQRCADFDGATSGDACSDDGSISERDGCPCANTLSRDFGTDARTHADGKPDRRAVAVTIDDPNTDADADGKSKPNATGRDTIGRSNL
jgi:hypothetical protein